MNICVTNLTWIPNHRIFFKDNTVYSKPLHNKRTNLHTISQCYPTPLHPVELGHQHHDNRYHHPYLWCASRRGENGCVPFCFGKHWEIDKKFNSSQWEIPQAVKCVSDDVSFMKMMFIAFIGERHISHLLMHSWYASQPQTQKNMCPSLYLKIWVPFSGRQN